MNEIRFAYNARVRITTIDIRRPVKQLASLYDDIDEHDVYPVPDEFQTRPDGTLYDLRKLAQTINFSLYSLLPSGSSAGFDLSIENNEIVAQLYVYNDPFWKRSDYNKQEYRAQLAKAIYEMPRQFADCFV